MEHPPEPAGPVDLGRLVLVLGDGLVVVLRTVWVFNNFDIIYMITGGGPAGASSTMPIFIYDTGWTGRLVGMASAASILLLLFLVILCVLYFSVINRWEKEDK